MISVTVYKQGNYPVNAKKVRDIVKKTFEKNGIVSSSIASVAIVGKDKMEDLVKQYLDDGFEHPVLSFPTTEVEGPFVSPPGGKMDLGEIVISYPWALEEAKKKSKLIDEVVCELAEHGALHLIGIHHE